MVVSIRLLGDDAAPVLTADADDRTGVDVIDHAEHSVGVLVFGYNGYLPTPEQHGLGGYETWSARSCYLEVDAEPKIRGSVEKLLQQLADGKQTDTR